MVQRLLPSTARRSTSKRPPACNTAGRSRVSPGHQVGSLQAIRALVTAGITCFDVDVCMSSDNVLFVSHPGHLRTVLDIPATGDVSEYSWETLNKLASKATLPTHEAEPGASGVQIPTLRQVFALLLEMRREHKPVQMSLELKGPAATKPVMQEFVRQFSHEQQAALSKIGAADDRAKRTVLGASVAVILPPGKGLEEELRRVTATSQMRGAARVRAAVGMSAHVVCVWCTRVSMCECVRLIDSARILVSTTLTLSHGYTLPPRSRVHNLHRALVSVLMGCSWTLAGLTKRLFGSFVEYCEADEKAMTEAATLELLNHAVTLSGAKAPAPASASASAAPASRLGSGRGGGVSSEMQVHAGKLVGDVLADAIAMFDIWMPPVTMLCNGWLLRNHNAGQRNTVTGTGMGMAVWIVDDEETARRVVEFGSGGGSDGQIAMISNNPLKIQKIMRRLSGNGARVYTADVDESDHGDGVSIGGGIGASASAIASANSRVRTSVSIKDALEEHLPSCDPSALTVSLRSRYIP